MGFLEAAETCCHFWGDKVISHWRPGEQEYMYVCVCGREREIQHYCSPTASIFASLLCSVMLIYSALLKALPIHSPL